LLALTCNGFWMLARGESFIVTCLYASLQLPKNGPMFVSQSQRNGRVHRILHIKRPRATHV
jgi:hypothetical protein